MNFLAFDKKFVGHFWTQFLGAFNDNLFKNALALLITYQSVSVFGLAPESVVALAGGVFILPFFIFSAFAGQVADRFEKSFLIKVTKWTEFLFMLMAAIGFYYETFSLLLVVLFLMGGQSAIFGPLKYGVLPFLSPPDLLTRANALVGASTFAAILLGTVVGGYAVATENALVLVSVMVIIFSIIGIITSWFIPKVKGSDPTIKPDWTLIRPIGKLTKRAFGYPKIFRAMLMVSWFWFMGAAILSVLPPLAKDVLLADESVGTFFLALFTIGMGAGSKLADWASERQAQIGAVAPAAFFMAIFCLTTGLMSGNWGYFPLEMFNLSTFLSLPEGKLISFSLLIMSISGGLYVIPLMTFIQQQAPRSELSQIIATNNIFNSFFMVVASLTVMGLYAIDFSTYEILIVLGVKTFFISFFIYVFYSEQTLHFIAKILVRLLYRVEFKGKENIPLNGPVVLCANHVSFIDWLFIMAASPRPVRFVIGNEFYEFPMAAFWLSQAKLIPITSRKANADVFERAQLMIKDSIEQEAVIGIFPEGAITRNGQMRRFQKGVIDISEKYGIKVVPITLTNLWGSFLSFKGGRLFYWRNLTFRRKLKVIIDKPLGPKELSLSKLRSIIVDNLERN